MNRLRKSLLIIFFAAFCMVAAPVQQTQAAIPAWIIALIKKGVAKVLRAIDLMIQRLQNKTIWLQNLQKTLENKLSQFKLTEIAQWTEKQRLLYKKYYDELWKVRNTISTYKRIHLIVQRQKQIIERYRFMWQMINQDKHFTKSEIDYMYVVYSGILNESVYNIDQLFLVINSFRTQMSDAKRLEMINETGERVEQNYADLQQFNNQNIQLSLNRARDEHEIESVKKLYDLE